MTTKVREASAPTFVGVRAGIDSVTNGAPMNRAEAIRSLLDDEALGEVLPPTLQTTYTSMREFTAAIVTALADHAEWRDNQPEPAGGPAGDDERRSA